MADLWSFFLRVRSACVGFTFCGGTLKLGKYYTIFLSSMMLFKRFERSIYRNLTELCTTPASAVLFSPALDVIRAQLQRLQQTGKIRTLSTAVRAIQTHSHELCSKILNLNLDLNSVSETDITLAVLKKQTNKQTIKNHIRTKYKQLQFIC